MLMYGCRLTHELQQKFTETSKVSYCLTTNDCTKVLGDLPRAVELDPQAIQKFLLEQKGFFHASHVYEYRDFMTTVEEMTIGMFNVLREQAKSVDDIAFLAKKFSCCVATGDYDRVGDGCWAFLPFLC